MLQIKNIKKTYVTGELTQTALNDVSLNFRSNEFVAVLGPSGSGKTTLLNIIGGLDRYDSGDLIINGISTKKYKDRDWDSYRNHTIGFVFQSYNLIPHQSILSNVELALTISGISKKERRQKALNALEKVGLSEHVHKRPNQLSGGQMQRVAIARALVNDPDILLADEPTGALDSVTSVQVMELLNEVAKDRLVIMVTHNPELADDYATRIVKLKDGKVIDDTAPLDVDEEEAEKAVHKNMGKSSMSFLTSLSLSFNNLRTKKGRTILTSFAGSIGIIGIALILSISTGVNNYINDIQRNTMTSYPITIDATTFDLSSMMSQGQEEGEKKAKNQSRSDDEVYSDPSDIQMMSSMTSSITKNNLTEFKKFLTDNEDIEKHLGDNGIVYSYDLGVELYSYDGNGEVTCTDGTTLADKDDAMSLVIAGDYSSFTEGNSSSTSFASTSAGQSMLGETPVFDEALPGTDGELISKSILDNYKLIYGDMPKEYNEFLLVTDNANEVSLLALYKLGILKTSDYQEMYEEIKAGNKTDIESVKISLDDVVNKEFYYIPNCDKYVKNDNGTYDYIGGDITKMEEKFDDAIKVKISGVIRHKKDSDNYLTQASVLYTKAFTDYVIDYTNKSDVVKAQEDNKDTNVVSGMAFEPKGDKEKVEDTTEYLKNLSISEKAKIGESVVSWAMSGEIDVTDLMSGYQSQMAEIPEGVDMTDMPEGMDMSEIPEDVDMSQIPEDVDMSQGAEGMDMTANMDEESYAQIVDYLSDNPDDEIMLKIYDKFISSGSYDDNMTAFGVLSYDAPTSISIYVDTFEDKDEIEACIKEYNNNAKEEDKITYTDYIGLLMSSVTTIINVISYVLIAFVSVSLVVSSIMIGIITYISVLERTKEIGILRAIGASKKNISQVFNAETFIIGLISGLIGIGITLLMLIPINAIIHAVTKANNVNGALPVKAAVVLVILSVILTSIGGIIPSKKAAKKDPVTALRTE